MGCGSSSGPVSPSRRRSSGNANDQTPSSMSPRDKYFQQFINVRSPMTSIAYSEAVKVIPIVGDAYKYNLNYCYVSQRGYYPDQLHKANQDSYVVCETLLKNSSYNLFGVFDGHGEYGDLCSHFAADLVTVNMAKELERVKGNKDSLDASAIKDAYLAAFADANYALHNHSDVDDSLSGTTGITVFQHGDQLMVANVGDSRAIVASKEDGKLVYSPLSSDQTPYRKDERERLKKAGAKIMTIDQLEGNEPMHENFGTELGDEIDEGGDPPRVWDSTLEQPGCAFSRSIGDAVAKRCGVSAVPEVLEWTLSPDDKFAVIASDGVFEFITSQAVVDMIAKFKDPLEAARHVVSEAYRLWLTYDDRTDDITIIILEFKDMKPAPTSPRSPRHHSTVKNPTAQNVSPRPDGGSLKKGHSMSQSLTSHLQHGSDSRPVRKVMSRRKRMDISEHWDDKEAIAFDFDAVENTKTDEEIARISQMLSTNFMFANLNPIQKDQIFKVMSEKNVEANELIIREGDVGDEMYIVDKGQFTVSKKDHNGEDQVVFTYTREGSAFGELSLMYGKPRAASVTAKTKGKLWSIGRAAFRAVIMRGKEEGLLEVYQTIPVLRDLSVPTLHRLCLSSTENFYEKGETVVESVTVANETWAFAVIVTGVLRFIPVDETKKRQLRAELTYFSMDEIGTTFSEVTADCKTKLTCIPKAEFIQLVGKSGVESMKEHVLKSKHKGKRHHTTRSLLLDPEKMVLPQLSDKNRFTFDHAITMQGDFAYIGTFKDAETQRYCSVKVIAKSHCKTRRMDAKLLQERNFIATVSNLRDQQQQGSSKGKNHSARTFWLPTLLGTYSDAKLCYMVFHETFVCDFSMALHNNAISSEQQRQYYMAAIYCAICAVHEYGLHHRFINMGSVLLNAAGVPKLCDFRYAKRMDGSRSFTICGDPLFFAPEIVCSKGYDYAADLWAYGILLYELYENTTPFGEHDTEETTIFKALTAFQSSSSLKFTDATQEPVRELIGNLLQLVPHKRAGYLNSSDVTSAAYFTGIDWAHLHQQPGIAVDIQGSVDISAQFDDASLEAFNSPIFEQF